MSRDPIVASPEWATTVIIASGPSRSADQLELVREARERNTCRVIAINREWEWAPWADVIYAADPKFWRIYGERICREFDGCRWTGSEGASAPLPLCYVRCRGFPGLSRDPTLIHGGQNGGYQAMNLAYHFGARRRIVLVGFDMQYSGGRAHHFGDHDAELGQAADPSKWVPLFKPLAADLAQAGVDVVNCSGATALTCFRRGDLAEALA